jgi:hypothetical protein
MPHITTRRTIATIHATIRLFFNGGAGSRLNMALKRSCVSCGVFASDAFARSKNLSAIIAAGSEDGFGLYVSVLGAITGGEEGVAEGVAAPACGIPAPIIDIMLPIVNGVSEDLLDLCFHTLDLVHRTRGCGESLHISFIIRANRALMYYNGFHNGYYA